MKRMVLLAVMLTGCSGTNVKPPIEKPLTELRAERDELEKICLGLMKEIKTDEDILYDAYDAKRGAEDPEHEKSRKFRESRMIDKKATLKEVAAKYSSAEAEISARLLP